MHGIMPRRLAGVAGGVLLVLALLPATALAASAPTITSPAGSFLTIGVYGAFEVTTQGSLPMSITEVGTLPSGVTFVDNGDGTATVAGVPALGSASSYPITFTASNGTLPNAVQPFTLTLYGAVANGITSAASASFTVGSPGYFLVTTNFSPVATTISEAGTLPSGVTFVNYANGTAALTGTPAAATDGSYPITITASNGTQSVNQSFSLTVSPAGSLSFTSAASTTFGINVGGSFTITTTGSPIATSIYLSAGTLPSGVTFYNYGNGTALISGVSTFAGTYPLTITASNGTTTVSQSFTLTVGPGTLSFTSAASTTFGINVGGSFTITTTGSPIATSIYLSAGTLPSGVTFYNYGNGTALISGVSTFAGTYPLTITASNGTTTVSQSFTLTVGPGTLSFTSAASTTFGINVGGSFTITTTGSPIATSIYLYGRDSPERRDVLQLR